MCECGTIRLWLAGARVNNGGGGRCNMLARPSRCVAPRVRLRVWRRALAFTLQSLGVGGGSVVREGEDDFVSRGGEGWGCWQRSRYDRATHGWLWNADHPTGRYFSLPSPTVLVIFHPSPPTSSALAVVSYIVVYCRRVICGSSLCRMSIHSINYRSTYFTLSAELSMK